MLLLTGILVGLVGRFGTPPDQLPPKQTFWDSPVVASDRAQVQSCLDSPHQLTYFLAATARHSGDWLFALLIASCGLKLDDEAVKVSVAVYDVCPAPLPIWLAGRRSRSAQPCLQTGP